MKTQCIKIDALRKTYSKDMNLEKWISDENNLYVGRRGRIFIDGEIFHYKESKWHNPYKVTDYSLEDSLKLYKNHILSGGLKNELDELEGLTLGCFCDQSDPCHAKVLMDLYEQRDDLPKAFKHLKIEKKEKEGLCSATLKNGNPCKNKGKYDGLCGIHNK